MRQGYGRLGTLVRQGVRGQIITGLFAPAGRYGVQTTSNPFDRLNSFTPTPQGGAIRLRYQH